MRNRSILLLGICVISLVFSGCNAQKKVDTMQKTMNEHEQKVSEDEASGEALPAMEGATNLDADMSNSLDTQIVGIKQIYEENFPIGIALPRQLLVKIEDYDQVISNNFNSITCENEMKPESILDMSACQANIESTYEKPAVQFEACKLAVDYALAHDMKMRLHTLVWHSQTPRWFFTEDYTEKGELVGREVMLKRMENYIAEVLGYFKENYPGLIYAVDVVNEAFDKENGDANGIRQKDNLWYETVGDDYYYQAFVFAKKYAAEDMKLFYNDYACMWKQKMILKHLKKAKSEGLIDGIGMQSHLTITDDIEHKFMDAVKQFCKAGYEVQATELDIGTKEATEDKLLEQGKKYKAFFGGLKALQEEGYAVTGITIWGMNDEMSWRKGENALLFDGNMNPKPAYEGAKLSEVLEK